MANGYDCKYHDKLVADVNNLQIESKRQYEQINHLEDSVKEYHNDMEETKKILYTMPIKIVIWTVTLISAINGVIIYIIRH